MKNADRAYHFGSPGQRLWVQEWGDIGKPPVLLIHGFPGCAQHATLMSDTPYWNQFRLISLDRPGYGQSDLQRKMTPLDFAAQIEKLVESIELENLSLISVSGGAPYAMAVAYKLGSRVEKLISVAGVAPLNIKNFSFMNSQQKKSWILRNFIPSPVLHFAMNRVWQKGLDNLERLIFTNPESFSPEDRLVFQHPKIGPALMATTRMALHSGPGGVLHDMKIYSRPWGFPLEKIHCPVILWHGGKDDVVHFRFTQEMNSQLPNSKINFVEGEGHYSILLNCRDQILKDIFN